MERRDDETSLAERNRLAVERGEDLDVRAGLAHPRRADEDAAQRLLVARELEVSLEACDLAAVRIAVHGDVHEPEMLPVEDDHPGARPEDGSLESPNCLVEPVEPHQTHERRRFATWHDEAVQAFELVGLADFDRVRTEPAQHLDVLPEVALDRQNPDLHGVNRIGASPLLRRAQARPRPLHASSVRAPPARNRRMRTPRTAPIHAGSRARSPSSFPPTTR